MPDMAAIVPIHGKITFIRLLSQRTHYSRVCDWTKHRMRQRTTCIYAPAVDRHTWIVSGLDTNVRSRVSKLFTLTTE